MNLFMLRAFATSVENRCNRRFAVSSLNKAKKESFLYVLLPIKQSELRTTKLNIFFCVVLVIR